jgi:type I restriction enzyme S subunit
MSEWKEVELKSISEYLNRGISPKYSDEGNLIINQKCIRNNVVTINEARFSSVDKKINAEKYLKPLDILVNSTGTGTLGRTAQIKKIGCPISVDTHVTIVRPNNSVDKKFIALQLALKEPEIVALGKGATNQQELGREELGSIKILLPPLPTQQRIASILSAYDDLIENNLKRIKLLEEIAQRTYEEWFVKFRINGVQLEVSENGLPEGWDYGTLNDIISFQNGFAFKSTKFVDIGQPVIKIKNIGNNTVDVINTDCVEEEYANTATKFKLSVGDLVIAMTGATVGKVGYVPYSKKECYLNQRVGRFVELNGMNNLHFVFSLMTQGDGLLQVLNLAGGAAQPNISGNQILSIKTVIATKDILNSFQLIANENINQILNLQNQNRLLKESRDILLPRLMSGKLGV